MNTTTKSSSEMSNLLSIGISQKITYIFENIQFVVCLIGIVGNIYTFSVYSRQRLATLTLTFYAKCMALSDLFVLLLSINNWTKYMFNADLDLVAPIFCSLVSYLVLTFSGISVWLLALIALDRFLIISYAHFHKSLMRKLPLKVILVLLILIWSFLIYLPIATSFVFVRDTSNTTSTFSCQLTSNSALVSWLILGNVFFVTFVLNNTLTLMLFVSLIRSRVKLRVTCIDGIRQRDRKFAITSVMLNLVCFVFKMPLITFMLVTNYVIVSADVAQMGFVITSTIFTLDNAASFFVNISGNTVFKKEFWTLVSTKRSTQHL